MYDTPQDGNAILIGFLGGATASQVRIGEPLFSHILFPSDIALLVWGGLCLRDGRLRTFVSGR